MGLVADSVGGAPFKIIPRGTVAAPSGGTRAVGQMYVDHNGNLFIWTLANVWRKVAFV